MICLSDSKLSRGLVELLEKFELKVKYRKKIFGGNDAFLLGDEVFVKKNLEREYTEFLILHEIGHFIKHGYSEKPYTFHPTAVKTKIENQADTFACNIILKNSEIDCKVNLYEKLCMHGVPKDVAKRYYSDLTTVTRKGNES